jgi:hypothetical protein
MTRKPIKPDSTLETHYDSVLGDISKVIDAARSSAARSVELHHDGGLLVHRTAHF